MLKLKVHTGVGWTKMYRFSNWVQLSHRGFWVWHAFFPVEVFIILGFKLCTHFFCPVTIWWISYQCMLRGFICFCKRNYNSWINKKHRSDKRGTLPDIAANAHPLRVWFCHTSVYRFTHAKTFAVMRQIATLSHAWVVIVRHFNHARRGRALAAISGKVPGVSGVCYNYIY